MSGEHFGYLLLSTYVTLFPGEKSVTNEEISEIYRQRWGIECLWKFLKMHLKLDKLITKNINGITIQIYSTLIAYLILQLVEIPQEFGNKLLDKLAYLEFNYLFVELFRDRGVGTVANGQWPLANEKHPVYFQACMCQEISYIHWMNKIIKSY